MTSLTPYRLLGDPKARATTIKLAPRTTRTAMCCLRMSRIAGDGSARPDKKTAIGGWKERIRQEHHLTYSG